MSNRNITSVPCGRVLKPSRMLLLCLLAVSTSLHAQADTSNAAVSDLAQRLIQLRGEVEDLQGELDIEREEHKGRMAYLSAQKTELEAAQDREQTRIEQLETELAELRERAENAGADAQTLQTVALQVAAGLREQVSAQLPFKREERLQALQTVITELEAGVANPQRSINRLWAFVEDELRLSRENAIYSQTISVDGESLLVDVAKLGSIAMYFQTRDGEFGMAQASGGSSQGSSWRWVKATDSEDRKQIAELFDSLRKQIRQGYFELPNALPPRRASTDSAAVTGAGL